MDFNDTPEQAEFRAEARAWLARTAPAYEKPDGTAVGVFSSTDGLDIAKDWQACKADAGWAALQDPISPVFAHAASATATTGSSTGRRSGTPTPISPTTQYW